VITYRLDVDDKQVNAAFKRWEQHIPGLHNLVLARVTQRMAANSQQHFLTGQALKVRTGRLRSSIMARRVSDFEYGIGTNVVYARIHEFGGTIQIPEIRPVNKKAMRWVGPGGRVFFAKRVRAHSVVMPRRSFIGAAIDYTVFSGQSSKLAELALAEHIKKYWEAGNGG
jgi:phage gpG-like protein